jgi:hypothetical protein
MKSTLNKQWETEFRAFRFCTLVGTEHVRINGNQIAGQFKEELTEFYGPKTGPLISEFVNLRNDAEAWLRFVRLYGPLEEDAESGLAFRTEIRKFQDTQDGFRRVWRDQKRSGWQTSCQVTVSHLSGKTSFRVPNLYWFLLWDLLTLEPERLKVCERPDCPAPYFVAHHLGQRYCGDDCATWAQLKWKREWWVRSQKERTSETKKSTKNSRKGKRR